LAQTALEGAAVFVNSNGKLVTNNSSQRFKEESKPMDQIAALTATMKEQTTQIQKIRAQLGLVINRFSGNSRSD